MKTPHVFVIAWIVAFALVLASIPWTREAGVFFAIWMAYTMVRLWLAYPRSEKPTVAHVETRPMGGACNCPGPAMGVAANPNNRNVPCALCGKPGANHENVFGVPGPLCDECYIDLVKYP
ncbi:MAG: hypothetical protein ACFUZC_04905 [Chthoniobacteraceae bacterium]